MRSPARRAAWIAGVADSVSARAFRVSPGPFATASPPLPAGAAEMRGPIGLQPKMMSPGATEPRGRSSAPDARPAPRPAAEGAERAEKGTQTPVC